ncbi:MAG: hypothetical protein ACK4UJ_04285 [Leptonema sp. (in: bacteria)]
MENLFYGITISIVSGLLSALFTFSFFYIYAQKIIKKKMENIIDEYIEVFKIKLKESFQEAGKELLPSFKEEVKKGFKESIKEVLSPNVIDETAKQIAKTSSSLIQNSLNLLMGKWSEEDNKI